MNSAFQRRFSKQSMKICTKYSNGHWRTCLNRFPGGQMPDSTCIQSRKVLHKWWKTVFRQCLLQKDRGSWIQTDISKYDSASSQWDRGYSPSWFSTQRFTYATSDAPVSQLNFTDSNLTRISQNLHHRPKL